MLVQFTLSGQNKVAIPFFLNRKEFVSAFVDYAFNKSVTGVFEEFKRGFLKVCDYDVMGFFQPEELQAVMVGQENYDWNVFKQVCRKINSLQQLFS